jgi:diguanylate cyclase (GGDEF)-like protein
VGAATELADRIREEIANLQMYPRGRETATGVTVSIGVARHEGDADLDERSLLEAADLALYKAKHAGRNRVVVHEEAIVTAGEGTDRRTVPVD